MKEIGQRLLNNQRALKMEKREIMLACFEAVILLIRLKS